MAEILQVMSRNGHSLQLFPLKSRSAVSQAGHWAYGLWSNDFKKVKIIHLDCQTVQWKKGAQLVNIDKYSILLEGHVTENGWPVRPA